MEQEFEELHHLLRHLVGIGYGEEGRWSPKPESSRGLGSEGDARRVLQNNQLDRRVGGAEDVRAPGRRGLDGL